MPTSLEGFSGHENGTTVLQAPFKEIKGYEGHPPALKIEVVMSKVAVIGLLMLYLPLLVLAGRGATPVKYQYS